MATPLDITVLKEFQGVFPFLLVLVLTYAILSQTDWFKGKQGWAALVSTIAALMTLFSSIAMKTINLMAPWFVLFIIFATLVILAYMALGVEKGTIVDVIKNDSFGVGTWVIVIMLLIGLGSLFSVLNEEVGGLETLQGEDSSGSVEGSSGFWQTLFHPKVLGLVLVLLIAFFTIKYMTSNE